MILKQGNLKTIALCSHTLHVSKDAAPMICFLFCEKHTQKTLKEISEGC